MPPIWSRALVLLAWLTAVGWPGGAGAAAPLLDLPVQCAMGRDCFIQNFFDHDTSSAYRDYRCGSLSYDGHTGTDFRVRDQLAMQAGVPVVAAAPGVVQGTRDGEPDVAVSKRGRAALGGRDAGNGVALDHGDGWVTQYSHLRRGSVRVRPGQRVERGEVLGLVGNSGNADFPHVDFTIRKNGLPLDPFAPEGPAACTESPASHASLWSPAALPALAYQASGVLLAGFAPESPSREKAEAGAYHASAVEVLSPALVFWVEIFGARQDDHWSLELTAPDGAVLAKNTGQISRNMAIFLPVTGRKRGPPPWPAGTYLGRFRLERQGVVVLEEERRLTLPSSLQPLVNPAESAPAGR